MYYPYLRGKQFELIALKEFAEAHPNASCIIPIIEPVREIDTESASESPLNKAVSALTSNGIRCAVVLNPSLGDFERTYQEDMILNNLNGLDYIPAFVMNDNIQTVEGMIEKHKLSGCMLVFTSGVDSDNQELMNLMDKEEIQYIVGLENKSLKRTLRKNRKRVISLKNRFIKQPTNSDYRNKVDEYYSDDHSFFEEENYDGYSDYCVLPQEFSKSGAQPKSIAIHLSYKKNDEEVWVHHFVSDTETKGNLPGKFAEACQKVEEFYAGKDTTGTVETLLRYYREARYPGLGMLKKITVANHLELTLNLLSSAE